MNDTRNGSELLIFPSTSIAGGKSGIRLSADFKQASAVTKFQSVIVFSCYYFQFTEEN